MPEPAAVSNVCGCCGGPAPVFVVGLVSIKQPYCWECAAALEEQERQAERVRRVEGLLDRAGGGSRVRLASWSLASHPDEGDAKAAALEWLDGYRAGERTNVLVFGPVGTGKTGLAWGLVRALCEAEVEAALVNFRDFLWTARQAYREGLPGDERPHRIPVVALDDLGAERPTDWARDELATLVDRRHQAQTPTIVTSNYDPAELIERLGHDDQVVGQRIVSRLTERAVQIRTTGPDRRMG